MSREYTPEDLQEALLRFIKAEMMGCGCVDGVINSVDEKNLVCEVQINDNVHTNVPLRVMIGSQASVIEIPVAGTHCLIVFRDAKFNQAQILWVDQVDKLLINCKTLVQFNGGKLGGMVKLNDVVSKLNNLENDINNLKEIFSSWVPVPNDGGASLKTAAETWAGQELTPTQKSDLENTAIQQ